MSDETVLTEDQVHAIEAALTEAGDGWQTVAQAHPLVAGIQVGNDVMRDTVTLIAPLRIDVNLVEGPVVASILYRNDVTGQWHHTGWSHASQDQVFRSAAWRYAQARAERDAARDLLAEQVRQAVAAGMTEVEAAKVAGVDRMTIRSWLGKR